MIIIVYYKDFKGMKEVRKT